MERNIQKTGAVNLVVMLLLGAAGYALARYANTLAGQVGSIFFGLGVLVSAISYFQMRLEESERLERLDLEEMARSRQSASLFAGADEDTFPARRSRQQFDKYFVPGFTVFLLLLQVAGAYFCWTWLRTPSTETVKEPAIALALYGLFGLVLFLLGKYSAGLGRLEGRQLLRPGASYILLNAFLSFLIAGCIAAVKMGFPVADLYAARVLTVLLGVVAIETLASLLFELYRPRVKGGQSRVIYEGRLISLLGQPEGLISTAAQALDYQFGFKVSETWLYLFLERALAWLVIVQLGILYLSTCVVFIAPGEEGLLERFGRPVGTAQPLEPGFHLKLPWGMDAVQRFRTKEIQSFNIGFVEDPEKKEQEKVVLWTVSHSKEEFNLMVASRNSAGATNRNSGVPVDLLTVGIPVQFQIHDVRAWAYGYTDAAALLEKIATREVIRYLVNVDLFAVMSTARGEAASELQKRIQARADELKLGVKIVFVGLQDIHPPVKVASAFQGVIGAGQENEAKLRAAEGYAARVVPMAQAEGAKKILEAEGYRATRVAAAAAQGTQFANRQAAFKAAPDVFLQRLYLQTLGRGATNARKYVLLTTNSQDSIYLNLEDKIRQDLFDIAVPGKK